MSTLRILFWNAGGVNSAKFVEFEKMVDECKADVYAIVEAGKSTEHEGQYRIPGFQHFTLKRSRQIASGMFVGVKESITAKMNTITKKSNTTPNSLEATQVEVWKNSYYTNIIALYNPPRNTPDLESLPIKRNTVIIGDFNAPSTRWGYKRTDGIGKNVEDFVDSNPFTVVYSADRSPTFLSYSGYTSTPDLVLAHDSICNRVSQQPQGDANGTGHRAILVSIDAPNVTKKMEYIDTTPKWNFHKADWKSYENITDKCITQDLVNDNPDQSLDNVTKALMKCVQACVPRGAVRKYKPFWNASLQVMKEERDEARKKAETTGAKEDGIHLRKLHASLQKHILKSKREAFHQVIKNIDYRKDGNKAHRLISTLNNEHSKKNEPILERGRLLVEDKDKAEAFCKYYASVSNYEKCNLSKVYKKLENDGLQPDENVPSDTLFDNDLNGKFHFAELESALRLTKLKKSPGVDGITSEMLIHLGPMAKNTILRLMNIMWDTTIPAVCRKAEVVPLAKKDKTADKLENYRPIALTSTFCKVLERMVMSRLNSFLEEHNLVAPEQSGFRKHRSTIDQIVRVSQDVKDGFQRKESTLAVLVDFKAAYDTVCRQILIEKLWRMNVPRKIIRWVMQFLAQRFIRVRVNQSCSGYRQTHQGLPQGAVSSPTLFNVMVNDLPNKIKSIGGANALMYADDLIIWTTGSCIVTMQTKINEALSTLKNWTEANKMTVNTEKTTYQLFSMCTAQHQIQLQYNGLQLSSVKSKYLGVHMDNKLTWKEHTQKLADIGKARLKILRRLSSTRWGATQDVLSTTYKTYVRPVLEYGREAFCTASQTNIKILDLVQNQALRMICGAAKSTPITAMEIQTQIEPLSIRRERAAIVQQEKQLRLNDSYWESYEPPVLRIPSQIGFSAAVNNMKTKFEIEVDVASRKPFPPPSSSLLLLPKTRIKLIDEMNKKDTMNVFALKQLSLRTIHTLYPSNEWLHVFTDGSADAVQSNAGAGVYSIMFQKSAAAGRYGSCFDGEMEAIKIAFELIRERTIPRKIVVFVDSRAAIQAITSKATDCSITNQCQKLSHDLIEDGWSLILQWIPSHCGIEGNEKADELAKLGSNQRQHTIPMSIASYKNMLKIKSKTILNQAQEDVARGKRWESLLEKPIHCNTLPRSTAVAIFRITTGHDFLYKHLKRIGVKASSMCPLCKLEDQNAEHLLVCPALDQHRALLKNQGLSGDCLMAALYWQTRRDISEVEFLLQS